MVGADGFRSQIRRRLFPDTQPVYAGYPAWRGIIEEALVADAAPVDGTVNTVCLRHAHSLFYLVPGRNGTLAPGHRRLNWLIYDGGAPADLMARRVDGKTAVSSVEGLAPGQLQQPHLDYLYEVVGAQLPPWFRQVIVSTPDPYAQAVYDLTLPAYVQGRVCLVGDASTIARPHTGSGATKAIEDALALADALRSETSVDSALAKFDAEWCTAGNALVRLGKDLGRQQVTAAPDWTTLDEQGFAEWIHAGASARTYMFRAGAS